MIPDENSINGILKPFIGPWYESLVNPLNVQWQILNEPIQKDATLY